VLDVVVENEVLVRLMCRITTSESYGSISGPIKMAENINNPDTAALALMFHAHVDNQYVVIANESNWPFERDLMLNNSAVAHQRGFWRIRKA
jgi:hypothetical protein